jgi:anti-sigma factor RsiW
MTACPDKRLMLHALVDGELDAGNALEVEGHAESCAGCAAEITRLRALRTALTAEGVSYRAPAHVADRAERLFETDVIAATPPPYKPQPRRRRWESGLLAGALAAGLVGLAIVNTMPTSISADLVDSHIRSLQAQHLVDVETSDRHVVRPWFNGKVDFAPPVIELAEQGFPLVGGRLDYIKGRQTAALVYRRRAHTINLFIWPGQVASAPMTERREGYTLVRWGRGGLVFWAVSDIDPADLESFQEAYAARAAT